MDTHDTHDGSASGCLGCEMTALLARHGLTLNEISAEELNRALDAFEVLVRSLGRCNFTMANVIAMYSQLAAALLRFNGVPEETARAYTSKMVQYVYASGAGTKGGGN